MSQTMQQETPVEIERVIGEVVERYIADLRMLSEEFGRLYSAQLSEKDVQIREKDAQIGELHQRIAELERERDTLNSHLQELRSTSAKYIADLRVLSEELSRRVEATDVSSTQ